jgi:hypothetical protein
VLVGGYLAIRLRESGVTDDDGVVFLVEFFGTENAANCLVNVFGSHHTALLYCYHQLVERTRDLGDIKFGTARLEHPLRHPDAADGGLHNIKYVTDGTEWWFIHRCFPL